MGFVVRMELEGQFSFYAFILKTLLNSCIHSAIYQRVRFYYAVVVIL